MLSIYKAGGRMLKGTGIGSFYPAKVVDRFLFNTLYHHKPVEVLSSKMFLTSNSSFSKNIIWFGHHEPFTTEVVRAEIKRGNVALDLGANLGYYTLIFAEAVRDTGRVFAFEPNPSTFTLLRRSVEINGCKHVTLEQKAISNKTGKINFYLTDEDVGSHSIYESRRRNQSIEVETIRLDDYFKDHDSKIDFIKMDIEGAECDAIEGMSLLLQRNEKLKIVTEFHPFVINETGRKILDLPRMLLAYGFKLYNINEQEKKIETLDILKLSEMAKQMLETKCVTNLLWIRE